jgi:hypothetical protein
MVCGIDLFAIGNCRFWKVCGQFRVCPELERALDFDAAQINACLIFRHDNLFAARTGRCDGLNLRFFK